MGGGGNERRDGRWEREEGWGGMGVGTRGGMGEMGGGNERRDGERWEVGTRREGGGRG